MLIGVGDAPVVFFFIFVVFSIWSRIAALPERLNKLVALGIRAQLLERGELFIGDDPADILVQPPLVIRAFFFLGGFALLLFAERPFQRVLLLVLVLRGLRNTAVGILLLLLFGILSMKQDSPGNQQNSDKKKRMETRIDG